MSTLMDINHLLSAFYFARRLLLFSISINLKCTKKKTLESYTRIRIVIQDLTFLYVLSCVLNIIVHTMWTYVRIQQKSLEICGWNQCFPLFYWRRWLEYVQKSSITTLTRNRFVYLSGWWRRKPQGNEICNHWRLLVDALRLK